MTNVYELTGSKVILKNMPEYLVNAWYDMYDSEELRELDPPIGVAEKPQYFSIHALYSPEMVIGMMAIYNYTSTSAEIGIRIWNKNYWNQGYGGEAMRLLMDFAFNSVKNPAFVILVKTPITNIRSQKCYKKVGFVRLKEFVVEGHNMVLMEARRVLVGKEEQPCQ